MANDDERKELPQIIDNGAELEPIYAKDFSDLPEEMRPTEISRDDISAHPDFSSLILGGNQAQELDSAMEKIQDGLDEAEALKDSSSIPEKDDPERTR